MVDRGLLVNTDAGRVTRTDRGGVAVFDDPAAGWVVRLWAGTRSGQPYVRKLRVDVRPGGPPITSARLASLPLTQMQRVAVAPTSHPDEVYFRLLAAPKPPGQRVWDDGHWDRVLAAYDWAASTSRPGGPVQAIADLWGVTTRPTAYRWLSTARRRAADADRPRPQGTGADL